MLEAGEGSGDGRFDADALACLVLQRVEQFEAQEVEAQESWGRGWGRGGDRGCA